MTKNSYLFKYYKWAISEKSLLNSLKRWICLKLLRALEYLIKTTTEVFAWDFYQLYSLSFSLIFLLPNA